MHFDLMSDLHDNFWSKDKLLNYSGLGTSLVAVVAGDISTDWDYTYEQLLKMAKSYRHVIFVDGNHEHGFQPNLAENCQILQEKLHNNPNITFLYKTCIVLDDTAFVGCNGWWTYDFCGPEISTAECWNKLLDVGFTNENLSEIYVTAKQDAKTLINQVESFDADPRINNIIVVTHTAPLKKFAYINPNMDQVHLGRAGSSFMKDVLVANKQKKIRAWCFGHVHKEYDEEIDGIRYVCHPRGREEENIGHAYYPKLITI